MHLLCVIDTVHQNRLGPYHVENASSRPITGVKQHGVVLVLGWVTAREYAMLFLNHLRS